ncbi:MAG: P-loop NTPase [Pseudomonadota bacterium]
MSLIEKAANRLKEAGATPTAEALARTAPARGGAMDIARSAPELRPDLDRGATSNNFSVDFASLRQNGFISPSQGHSTLAWDIRAIKRRLMTKMRFFNIEAREAAEKAGDLMDNRRENVILVTSARPEEGKSFVATNLALSLAMEDNINVLLVDADIPRPSVQRTFGLEASVGLTDKLRDPNMRLSDLLYKAENLPLTILPEGSHVTSTTELFSSEEMSELLDGMSRRYEDRIIIFDAPPVLATTESIVLAKHVDQVLFVVEACVTKEAAIDAALEQLAEHDNVNLVLNKSLIGAGSEHFGSYTEYDRR